MRIFGGMSLDVVPALASIKFLEDVPRRALRAAGKEARRLAAAAEAAQPQDQGGHRLWRAAALRSRNRGSPPGTCSGVITSSLCVISMDVALSP